MVIATKRIMPHRRLGLSSTPTLAAAQAANSSYAIGDPVWVNASGYVAATATDSVTSHSAVKAAAAGVLIAGFVQEPGAASSADTSKVGFVPALPGMIFKGQLVDSTGNSNAGALATIAQTDLFADMGLVKLSGDSVYGVDKGAASSRDCVRVVELIDAVGASGGEVGFVVRTAWAQLSSANAQA